MCVIGVEDRCGSAPRCTAAVTALGEGPLLGAWTPSEYTGGRNLWTAVRAAPHLSFLKLLQVPS